MGLFYQIHAPLFVSLKRKAAEHEYHADYNYEAHESSDDFKYFLTPF